MVLLAKAEHYHWLTSKVLEGWKYANKRDDERKLRPMIIEWEELSEMEREKDQVLAEEIFEIIQSLGYNLVKHNKFVEN